MLFISLLILYAFKRNAGKLQTSVSLISYREVEIMIWNIKLSVIGKKFFSWLTQHKRRVFQKPGLILLTEIRISSRGKSN